MSEDKLIKLPTVLELIQISRSKWYAMVAGGTAPKPVKINRASFWSLNSIQDYIQQVKAGKYE